jgi:hypothetical protein
MRGHHRDRRRQGVRCAEDDALAAGGAHRAAWHDDPVYIEAVAPRSKPSSQKLAFKPEMILASFHGVPKDYLLKGDPYYCQCHKTARLLRARLGSTRAVSCSPSSRASARRVAAALHRHDREGAGRARREELSRSSRPALPPTASKRWKKSRARTPRSFTIAGGKKFRARFPA